MVKNEHHWLVLWEFGLFLPIKVCWFCSGSESSGHLHRYADVCRGGWCGRWIAAGVSTCFCSPGGRQRSPGAPQANRRLCVNCRNHWPNISNNEYFCSQGIYENKKTIKHHKTHWLIEYTGINGCLKKLGWLIQSSCRGNQRGWEILP